MMVHSILRMLRCTLRSPHVLFVGFAIVTLSRVSVAQTRTSDDIVLPAPHVTPSAYATTLMMLSLDSAHSWHLAVNGHMVMRQDSARALVDSLSRRWVAGIQTAPVTRFQQVPMLMLEARANDVAAVQQRVAVLLQAPDLTEEERIWILVNGLRACKIAGGDSIASPAWMQLAHAYEQQLGKVPAGAPRDFSEAARVEALLFFMHQDWMRGNIPQAVQEGWHAYALMAAISSYETRALVIGGESSLDGTFQFSHLNFAALLAGQPQSRQALDSLARLLRQAIELPATDAARDTALRALEEQVKPRLDGSLALIALYGTPAVPMVATHWFNQSQPTQAAPAELAGATGAAVRMKPMNDGIIHIIQYGFYGCPEALPAFRAMARMLPTLPRGVDVQYYTTTNGAWGDEEIAPDAEAEHLRKYWLEHNKATLPITIWAGKKVPTPDGGLLPEISPIVEAYRLSACPTFVVIDGHGIVRFYASGGGPLVQQQLRHIVMMLDAERSHPLL